MPSTTKKLCRKCMQVYITKYSTLQEANESNDMLIYQEQHLSGICSDKCWYECSEDELMHYKYIKPYSFGSTEKVVFISP